MADSKPMHSHPMNEARHQLESLLRETPAKARVRQQGAFDEVARGSRRIVILGAGRLGRRLLQGLQGTDIEVLAFADNNSETWGKAVDGIPVLSPRDAAKKYSQDTTFVVAIWHPSAKPLIAALLHEMRALGCRACAFPVLFWRHSTNFLPYFFWDLPEKILQHTSDILPAFELLEDDSSRNTFVDQIRLRLHADFEIVAPDEQEQYFPGLFSLSSEECMVDCGSYTGDTMQSFISQTRNRFRKIVAFEADSAVLPTLRSFVSGLGARVVLYEAAVGSRQGTVYFAGDGMGGGCVAGSGSEVPCVRLDDALASERVSLIKMDIEGAELDALEGAQHIIRRDRPVLAICGYHRPDHLWQVLSRLKSLVPKSALHLRSHCADGLDTVCYSVPAERQVSIANAKSHSRAQGSLQ
jgi:FkbM family methyltransferase